MGLKFYRYIEEREIERVRQNKIITTRDPNKEPEKYFTTDYIYYGGLNAQAYLSIWYKPNWRLGPLSEDNRERGSIPEPRRIWPAFGQHGGGWEITLKVPVEMTEEELNTAIQIDVAGPDVDIYKAAGFFSDRRSVIREGIQKIASELGLEITTGEENILIRDGGFVILLQRPQNVYPKNFTVSLTQNKELKCLCAWVSAWADWDEIDLSQITYLNFPFSHPYLIRVRNPNAQQVPEKNTENEPPIREYVIFGPKTMEETESKELAIWRDRLKEIKPLLKKAFDLRFITSIEDDGVHVSKPGALVGVPSLCELP